MNHHAFSKIWIIITLVIFIAGGILGWQYWWAPKEEIKDETSSWQIYKNQKYGFEFKYPKNWAVVTERDLFDEKGFLEITFEGPGKIQKKSVESVGQEEQVIDSGAQLIIYYQKGLSYQCEGYSNLRAFCCPPECELTEIASNPATKTLKKDVAFITNNWQWQAELDVENPSQRRIFFLLKYNPENYTFAEKEFNQILSTFRFIEGETTGQTIGCEYKKGEYEFRVYDSNGRVTGLVNGMVKQEIPRSVYDNGDVVFFYPQDYYEYEIFSIKEGNYQLERSSLQEGEEITFRATNIPIFPGQTHRYKINWRTLAEIKSGVELLIDNNGDGSFEKTIPIEGTEFACEGFIAQIEK